VSLCLCVPFIEKPKNRANIVIFSVITAFLLDIFEFSFRRQTFSPHRWAHCRHGVTPKQIGSPFAPNLPALRYERCEIGNKTINHCLILKNRTMILKNQTMIYKNQTMILSFVAYASEKDSQCGKVCSGLVGRMCRGVDGVGMQCAGGRKGEKNGGRFSFLGKKRVFCGLFCL